MRSAGVGLLATVAALAGGNVLAILLAAGLVAVCRAWIKERRLSAHPAGASDSGQILDGIALRRWPPPSRSGLWGLFLVFLKFGAVIFGERICPAGVSSGRPRDATALVDSGATARRGGGGAGHAGTGIYHGDVHRLPARRSSRRGGRYRRHFPSRFFLCRRQPSVDSANSPLAESRALFSTA